MKMSNEEYLNNFWNNLKISETRPEEIIEEVRKINSKNTEDFMKELSQIILEPYMRSQLNEEINQYLKENYLLLSNPIKTLTVFFFIFLLSNCANEKNFKENYLNFYEICKEKMHLNFLQINDKNLIKEFVIFYVHLITLGTLKAISSSKNNSKFDETNKDLEIIFKQKNRDLFIEDLFFIFDKVEFSFNSFMIHNFNALYHEKVRNSLREIEIRNNIKASRK